jgi:hypothetical protein
MLGKSGKLGPRFSHAGIPHPQWLYTSSFLIMTGLDIDLYQFRFPHIVDFVFGLTPLLSSQTKSSFSNAGLSRLMISLDDFLVTTILCMYMYVYKNIYYTPYISRHNILQDGHPRIFSSFFFGVIIPYPVTFGVANQRNSPQGPQGPFRKSPGSSSSGPCTWFTCRSKCRRPTNRSALVPGPGWAMSKVGSGKFEDEENGTKGGKAPRFFLTLGEFEQWERLEFSQQKNIKFSRQEQPGQPGQCEPLPLVFMFKRFCAAIIGYLHFQVKENIKRTNKN